MPRKVISVVPPEATVGTRDGRTVCGALKRNGGRCQDYMVMSNGRCRRHRGGAPRGLANPNTIHGRYSADLPSQVLLRYQAALADPELLSVRDDIALLQAAITDTLAEIADAEASPDLNTIVDTVSRISNEWRGWEWTRMQRELDGLQDAITRRRSQKQAMRDVRELVREKAALVQQENRLLVERQQMITVEQYMVGMKALGAAVSRLIDDPIKLRLIDAEFRRLATVPDRGA